MVCIYSLYILYNINILIGNVPPTGCSPHVGLHTLLHHLASEQCSPSLRIARCSHHVMVVDCMLSSHHRLSRAAWNQTGWYILVCYGIVIGGTKSSPMYRECAISSKLGLAS